MALKLYGDLFSNNTKRVAAALEELEVPYEMVEVDVQKGAQKDPAYMKLQPFGKIPVLEDPELGITIFESRSILRYLANKHPEKGLGGTGAKSKALVDNWLEAEANNLNPYTEALSRQRVIRPMFGGVTDEAKVQDALAGLEQALDVLDQQLTKRKYLAGEAFSIADVSAMPYLCLAMTGAGAGDLVAKRPNVQAWTERIFSRNSWQTIEARARQCQ